jgi:type IV pilus assembly protein PilC
MAYRYLAIAVDGTETRGVLEVETEAAAERALWERKLTILDLQPLKRRLVLATLFPSVFGPKPRDLILFSKQLATLVDSGVAITAALQLLSGQVNNRYLARVLGEVEDDLHMGVTLSDAMAKHPIAFSDLYCRMVETGERSGNLGAVLNQLADYTEKVQVTLGKVRGAMTYPIFVLTLAVFVVILLVNVALPPMVSLFEEFDAVLPWPTRFLIGITNFSTQYGLAMLIAAAVLSVVLFIYFNRPSGKLVLHRISLRLPLFGKVIINGSVARLSRTMSALIRSGLALPEVISMSSRTIGNQILQQALEQVRQATLQGRGLSEPLSQVKYFPRMMSYLSRVGEETGTLDSHLATVADFYEGEVDRMLKLMTTVLEPALIIVIGIIVGFVAVAIIMPMYNLLGQIQL